jgi:hypothetical protein
MFQLASYLAIATCVRLVSALGFIAGALSRSDGSHPVDSCRQFDWLMTSRRQIIADSLPVVPVYQPHSLPRTRKKDADDKTPSQWNDSSYGGGTTKAPAALGELPHVAFDAETHSAVTFFRKATRRIFGKRNASGLLDVDRPMRWPGGDM